MFPYFQRNSAFLTLLFGLWRSF